MLPVCRCLRASAEMPDQIRKTPFSSFMSALLVLQLVDDVVEGDADNSQRPRLIITCSEHWRCVYLVVPVNSPQCCMLTHGLPVPPLPLLASLFSAENVFHSWANECHLCPFILRLEWDSPPSLHTPCLHKLNPPTTPHRKRNTPVLVLWFTPAQSRGQDGALAFGPSALVVGRKRGHSSREMINFSRLVVFSV